MRRIAPDKAYPVERELKSLELLKIHLERIATFLERLLIRLETLVIAGNILTAIITLKDVVSELKKSVSYNVPFVSIAVDKLDAIVKEVVSETRYSSNVSSNIVASNEAKKIIEEAKKIANMR